jgi:hypothetical protein
VVGGVAEVDVVPKLVVVLDGNDAAVPGTTVVVDAAVVDVVVAGSLVVDVGETGTVVVGGLAVVVVVGATVVAVDEVVVAAGFAPFRTASTSAISEPTTYA